MAPQSAATGFAIACELAEFGAQMVAARVRRSDPDITDAEVQRAVRSWWGDRPGAPAGDAVGIVRTPT